MWSLIQYIYMRKFFLRTIYNLVIIDIYVDETDR